MVIVAIPFIYGLTLARAGTNYLGFPFNTDDHMVYSAWMWQSAHGHLLFDNRFAIEAQPALTFHLYFLVLGWFARILGISLASNLTRIILAGLFVPLLYQLIAGVTPQIYTRKLVTVLTIIGGGIGFLVWHNFGRDLVIGRTLWMAPLTDGHLPTDVWQPEGFALPSLLVNGLFSASLCLILGIFITILAVKQTRRWQPVALGFFLFAILMNIHSYDALLIALVLLGFLTMCIGVKQVTKGWLVKSILICAGAIIPSIWFLHVLKADPVFAARADTPTFSAGFKSVLLGYLPMIIFGFPTLLRGTTTNPVKLEKRRIIGTLVVVLIITLLAIFPQPQSGLFLNQWQWGLAFMGMLISCYLLSDQNLVFNLVTAWALIGLIAPYFPSLFQRKLAMGLSIPWAILAGLTIAFLVQGSWRSSRNFATVFLLLFFGATSVKWFFRQIGFIREDVASTTVQPLYLKSDVDAILSYLNTLSNKRTVVIAMPGIPSSLVDADTNVAVPDEFTTPIVPDLNPILSGLSGVYTYAGHWSESPDYDQKRNKSISDLFGPNATHESRQELINSIHANYLVAVTPGSVPELRLSDLSSYGSVVVKGDQFELIKLKS